MYSRYSVLTREVFAMEIATKPQLQCENCCKQQLLLAANGTITGKKKKKNAGGDNQGDVGEVRKCTEEDIRRANQRWNKGLLKMLEDEQRGGKAKKGTLQTNSIGKKNKK